MSCHNYSHNCTCGMPDVCILMIVSVIVSHCLFNLCTCTVQSVYVQSVCCSAVASCRVAFVVSIILCSAREQTRTCLRLVTSKSRQYCWKWSKKKGRTWHKNKSFWTAMLQPSHFPPDSMTVLHGHMNPEILSIPGYLGHPRMSYLPPDYTDIWIPRY